MTKFRDDYLVLNSWKQWLFQFLNVQTPYESDDDGESPAVEVMKFKQEKGYFASM